jgi:hypothetical protein
MEFATSMQDFCLYNCRSGLVELSPLGAMNEKDPGMRVDSISMGEDWNLARQQPSYPRGDDSARGFPSASVSLSYSAANITKTVNRKSQINSFAVKRLGAGRHKFIVAYFGLSHTRVYPKVSGLSR